MSIIVNPGAEWHPAESSPEAAARNMVALVADLRAAGALCTESVPIMPGTPQDANPLLMGGTRHQADHDGRYGFDLIVDGRAVVVEMPGLALEAVRWLDSESGSIWDFPRLYVDGSSWIWKYAVSVIAEHEAE